MGEVSKTISSPHLAMFLPQKTLFYSATERLNVVAGLQLADEASRSARSDDRVAFAIDAVISGT